MTNESFHGNERERDALFREFVTGPREHFIEAVVLLSQSGKLEAERRDDLASIRSIADEFHIQFPTDEEIEACKGRIDQGIAAEDIVNNKFNQK